jgi:hypothetical protein
MFYLSHQCQMCHNFQYFAQHMDIFWGNVILGTVLSELFHLLGIDTDRSGSPCPVCCSRSGSSKIIQIRPDPVSDPQHWYKIFDYNS